MPFALVRGEKEEKEGVVGLKDLRSRQSYDSLTLESAIDKVKELLQ
ncbi:MAG TPA: His/Gly/Thr/Pro-type tRNA ligase C-terminal domain-containing protein [Spirochaetia bacterium]|nr:His/Gly/Thr/Pro-type tRNA ligase C-terminal domain-containing protein [Spirochaetia bacterium]